MASNSDFLHVSLNEKDIPGAKLSYSLIEKHSNTQLKRWLSCRALKTSGNKKELVERVRSCIEAGNDKHIPVSVDNGKWYEIKLAQQKKQTGDVPTAALAPITGWAIFPSVTLPKHFNRGHIHHHIVESVQFVGQSECCDSDSDGDNQAHIHDSRTAKPLQRGMDYFTSGHILDMKDCFKNGSYFIKAKVMASYTVDTTYNVMAQISRDSGFVKDASCDCKASALNRCSHVTGLLFALEDYINKFGPEPATCTSKPCEWNTGRKRKRNPQNVAETSYPSSKKKRADDIITYDPTPSFPGRTEAQTLSDFLNCIESSEAKSMWETLLVRQYSEYELAEEDHTCLQENVTTLKVNLSVPGTNAYEKVPVQNTSDWYSERRVRVTASESKSIANTKSPQAIYNILKNKLWCDTVTTKSMQYGKDMEDKAFVDYETVMSADGYAVEKTGFWVSKECPELGASPDGLVHDPSETEKDGLLEIKCPSVLRGKYAQDYETALSKVQLRAFCIHKKNGQDLLRENHAYYYQIQTQLGVLKKTWCDLLVWAGENNFLIVRVRFNELFWNNLKKELVSFHRNWLAPEYFLMNIPRRLLPKEIVECSVAN